ncbi:hypothetical protein OS493_039355 [Desmophyllum pertusum]|uniref:Galaxin-like repeats domain-containing protein n=1 Tax=Desmophyllum pertusum TaxID=174260 RepID=A0A9X0CCE7_9CNID|nr:hypothetical protein OS493_039355 [Desmophyllum pertusum]
MKIKTGMSPSVAFLMCAALFISFCSCESFPKRDEVELEGAPKIAGIEETDADWDEDKNVEDNNEHPDNDATEYGMERDGPNGMTTRERRFFRSVCGGRRYNPTFRMCCNGNIVSKPGIRPACCGRSSYNPTFRMCCNGNIVSRPGIRPACCGKVLVQPHFPPLL